ncbi:hypothetical protein [Hymenobacter algoricola]|uniref:Outer membrane protein beta-barrel domain-containing protein n=1 Tax=Hymenobacter algoricola TaxID=486267 RepID=A0ABP7MA03_9BACT
MAGISGRFQLIPHLELVADFGFNHVLRNVSGEVHTSLIGNPTGLTRNRSIGLRYRFNPRIAKAKPKAAVAPQ